jgi:4-amino-4-deoxy-L-arabinose transferase-like glycosyltransferase
MYNMGYPLLVLTPVFWLLGVNLLAVKLVHVLLGCVAIGLTYKVAQEAGAGRVGRLLAAAAWAFYLPASTYCVYLAKENLMIPLMLGLVLAMLKLAKTGSLKWAWVCGVLVGLLALVGNAALSLLGALIVGLLMFRHSLFRDVTLLAVMSVAAAAIATPWMFRNYQVIGAPVLNTNGGFNLYLGNNPAATGMFVSIADTPRGATWDDLRREGEVKASEVLKQEAVAWIKAHPAEFFQLALKKAVYFWTPPLHSGSQQGGLAESVVRVVWALQFVLLIGFAGVSLARKELRTQSLLCLWAAVLSYTAVHMLFYVIFRYREPIIPVLGVIAAMGFERLVMGKSSPPAQDQLRRE